MPYSYSSGRFVHINNDVVRSSISSDLGFSVEDREEHARRMRAIADIVTSSNCFALADFICPTKTTRKIFNPDVVVWVDRPTKTKFKDTIDLFQNPNEYEADELGYQLLIVNDGNYDEMLSQLCLILK